MLNLVERANTHIELRIYHSNEWATQGYKCHGRSRGRSTSTLRAPSMIDSSTINRIYENKQETLKYATAGITGGAELTGPMVYIKTYTFNDFY